jgi:hypothetical protein
MREGLWSSDWGTSTGALLFYLFLLSNRGDADVLSPRSFDGVFRIVREEGAGALFRGVGPNMARAMLMNASQLATYVPRPPYLLFPFPIADFSTPLLSLFFLFARRSACPPTFSYDIFKNMILSTGLIGEGLGLYFAASFMAVRLRFLPLSPYLPTCLCCRGSTCGAPKLTPLSPVGNCRHHHLRSFRRHQDEGASTFLPSFLLAFSRTSY